MIIIKTKKKTLREIWGHIGFESLEIDSNRYHQMLYFLICFFFLTYLMSLKFLLKSIAEKLSETKNDLNIIAESGLEIVLPSPQEYKAK